MSIVLDYVAPAFVGALLGLGGIFGCLLSCSHLFLF